MTEHSAGAVLPKSYVEMFEPVFVMKLRTLRPGGGSTGPVLQALAVELGIVSGKCFL